MQKTLTILFLFLAFSAANAQYWEKVDSVFTPSGVSVSSFTVPYFIDMNDDGHLDLFLGSFDNRIGFFWNNGNEGEPTFSKDTSFVASIYANGYMGTNSKYPVAADLNGDGVTDLLISGYNGILYYENKGSNSEPEWVENDTVFAKVNNDIGSDAKPAFGDIDNDGDLDLYVGTGESFMGGPEPGLLFAWRNTGSATEPAFDRDDALAEGVIDVGLNCFPYLADNDNNGTLDLLIGKDLKTLAYYKNTGTAESPEWTGASSAFTFVDNVHYWKAPALVDFDGDSDLDLIYGTDSGLLYYYEREENTFTKKPYFNIIQNDGSGASVSLADVDGDGDYDLLSGNWYGEFVYLENQGNASAPKFRHSSSAPFDGYKLPYSYSKPEFTDYDADGDIDIVSGALDGKLYLYENQDGSYVRNDTVFNEIDMSWSSNVSFGDIDDDGYEDFIVAGEEDGEYFLYFNNGEGGYINENSFIEGLNLGWRGAPELYDVDMDGDVDLIVGDTRGTINYFENTGTNALPEWTLNEEVFAGIEVKQSANLDFADMDGDNKPDMIIGEYDGNFTYYKNLFAATGVEIDPVEKDYGFELAGNYPNPFNPSTKIAFTIPATGDVNIRLYNSIGQEVTTIFSGSLNSGYNEVNFNASGLASGIYYYMVTWNVNGQVQRLSGKMSLLK